MKKTLLAMAFVGAVLPALAQKYTITGVAPAGATKMYLSNAENRQQRDSVAVVDGKFKFSGDAQGKVFGLLVDEASNRQLVILDGNVEVDFSNHALKGTAENEALAPWAKRLSEFDAREQAVYEEARPYGQSLPDTTRERLIAKLEAIGEARNSVLLQLFSENKDRLFPAYFLAMSENDMERKDIIAIVEANPRFANASVLNKLKGRIAGWKRQMPGVQFTDLTLPDTTGTPRKLSEFVGNGKYVLIDFWASWCGPCIREMPNVKLAYDRFHAKGFDVVGLSFDRDRKSWLGAVKRLNLPWHHLSDLKFWETEAAKVYGVNAIPMMLLVGPDGKIIANDLRGEALQQKLEELLGK